MSPSRPVEPPARRPAECRPARCWRWPGRDAVFFVLLTALMVPPIFTQLPNFLLMRDLGILNTYAAIVLPFFFMTPFAVFFLRQFFLGISPEIEEAARLDGAGHIRT